MSTYHIKLHGLTDIDTTSLKSMLKLANDLLSHDWQIIDHGQADLTIYSFDSDEGLTAWQQRGEGFTALLTKTGNITEPVDIILKKPLRTTNFSEALNLIEDKISAQQAKEIPRPVDVSPIKQKSKKTSSVLSSLSSGLSNYISGKKSTTKKTASLSLQLPEQNASANDTIVDAELLTEWLDGLNYSDNNHTIAALLGNLIPLNRLTIADKVRFELLEIYRTVIHKILFTRDIAAIKRDLDASAEHLKAIKTLSLAIDELTIGYKLIINQLDQKGENAETSKFFLVVINRSAEQLVQQVLHAYQYYRSPPPTALYELHQFYLFCESNQILKKQAEFKDKPNSSSFYHLYTQILLISIAEPYSLEKFDVVRLFKLMHKFSEQVEISPLTDKQKNTSSDFLMTGHFCLDGTKDHPPTAMAATSIETRSLSSTRLFNTQPVLLAIEQVFKRAAQASAQAAFDTDLQLLKKIIPQLNTSYERKYQRLPSIHDRQIHIANGIKAIHHGLKENHVAEGIDWVINNQGSGGIMATANSDECYNLHIGDFMGIFETELPVKLASVRWLNIDNNGFTHIGLELHPGHPLPVFCLTEDNSEYPALLLPENDELKLATTLIVNKGVYSPKRQLKVKGDGEPYSLTANTLINHTFNFEQFTFTAATT